MNKAKRFPIVNPGDCLILKGTKLKMWAIHERDKKVYMITDSVLEFPSKKLLNYFSVSRRAKKIKI